MLASRKTRFYADSIETRPGDPQTLACATYQAVEGETQSRDGDISILKHKENSLEELSVADVGGVLDMWWASQDTLYAARAFGEMLCIRCDDNGVISKLSSNQVTDVTLLAVDGDPDSIVTSDVAGNVYTLDPSLNKITQTIRAVHGARGWGHEVWGLALDKFSSSLVYTGGDDCVLACHDLRSPSTPVFTSSHYEMGVCCISPPPTATLRYDLLVGSYDESLAHWDKRSMKEPVRSCSIGGGVWRVKRSPFGEFALVAGMHSGFHVVDLERLEVVKTFKEHESLAYGADWLEDGLVATCSFYDSLVSVWDSEVHGIERALNGV